MAGEPEAGLDRERLDRLLAALEDMAAGDLTRRAPISPARDELDTIALGLNVLADEWRLAREQRERLQRQMHISDRMMTVGTMAARGCARDQQSPHRGGFCAR